jgi:hypothetical protein
MVLSGFSDGVGRLAKCLFFWLWGQVYQFEVYDNVNVIDQASLSGQRKMDSISQSLDLSLGSSSECERSPIMLSHVLVSPKPIIVNLSKNLQQQP